MPKKIKLIISCFNSPQNPSELPVGFQWAQDLLIHFPHKYKITLLLHGGCIKDGIKPPKPTMISEFLTKLASHGVHVVICKLCLEQDGFKTSQLLPFIKPIKFSIDYIAESQLSGYIVIYDAQKPLSS
jgi:intracellular sulfur oxidation DsrE/DsrF family protein